MFGDFREVMQDPDLPVVDARVLDVHHLGRSTSVEIEFVARGGEAIRTETEDFYFSPWPQKGGVRPVRYAPEDSEHYVQDIRLDNGPGIVILLGIMAGLFFLGGVLS